MTKNFTIDQGNLILLNNKNQYNLDIHNIYTTKSFKIEGNNAILELIIAPSVLTQFPKSIPNFELIFFNLNYFALHDMTIEDISKYGSDNIFWSDPNQKNDWQSLYSENYTNANITKFDMLFQFDHGAALKINCERCEVILPNLTEEELKHYQIN
jgi:hypothetical protein